MEILVTNDDGWGTAGIRMLAKEMTKLGHVTVVAPDSPRSAHSTCLSIGKPLYLNKIDEKDLGNAEVWTSNGTPADCVKLANDIVLKDKHIDLLVSGINHGNNCSVNVLYSGTMGACIAGTEHGIPSIGFSIDSHDVSADLHWLQPYLTKIAQHLLDQGFKRTLCYNVNAPLGELHGIRWTRQCMGHWEKEFEELKDEEGRTYYNMIGTYANEEEGDPMTDMQALKEGLISIQPVSIDMTDYEAL